MPRSGHDTGVPLAGGDRLMSTSTIAPLGGEAV
jgi:hypothetical protein